MPVPILALDQKLKKALFRLLKALLRLSICSAKKELATFFTRSKVLKAKNTIFKTFDLVFKVVGTDFGTRSKV